MMLAKIKTEIGSKAILNDAGKWVSDESSLARMLNVVVDQKMGMEYAPNVAKRRAEIAAEITDGKVIWYDGIDEEVPEDTDGLVF